MYIIMLFKGMDCVIKWKQGGYLVGKIKGNAGKKQSQGPPDMYVWDCHDIITLYTNVN